MRLHWLQGRRGEEEGVMGKDVVSSLERALREPIPDDGHSVEDLVPFGWAPGKYFYRACPDCGEGFTAERRSQRCRPCAVKALEAKKAKPVPVVRHEFWWITSPGWSLPERVPAQVTFKDGIASEVRAPG